MATVLAPPAAPAAPSLSARPFRRSGNPRDFQLALLASVILHLVALAAISFTLHIRPVQPEPPLVYFHLDDAMPGYDIEMGDVGLGPAAAIDAFPPQSPRLEVPVPTPPEIRPPLTSGAGGGGAGAGAGAGAASGGQGGFGGAGRASALERLSRGYTDPQLLAPADRLPPEELTEAEWLRLRLANQLGLYNDSLAAEAEAKLRSTDWTVKDKNGGRWGVSPGQIHLGNRTLPLPFGFSPSPGRREELAARMRSWNESQAQAARAEASQTFEQRVKAIRARQQAARDSARKAGGGR